MRQAHREIIFSAIVVLAITVSSLTACVCGTPPRGGDTAGDRDSGAALLETGDTGAPVAF